MTLYPRPTTSLPRTWPHAILIDPKTGVKLGEWEGDICLQKTNFFNAIKHIIDTSHTMGAHKLSKKRSHQSIIDQVKQKTI